MIKREDILKNEIFWTETIQNQLYSDLLDYIENNKISQTEIAKRLGVSRGRVSQILSGENLNFRINTLVKICLAIGKIPNINFENIDEFIEKDNNQKHGAIADIEKYVFLQIEELRSYNLKDSNSKELKGKVSGPSFVFEESSYNYQIAS